MAASDTITAAARARRFLAARARLRGTEALPWLVAIAAFFVFPDRLAFGSQILVMALFALSLDLILGYAGIITLGHAAFFGIGAYTVGLLAARLLLRYRGLTLLVLTLSTTFILQELGNVFEPVTGGYDGLPGLAFAPVLGIFDYDLFGRTAYLYALAVLFVCFCLLRGLVVSPFGRSLVGIRENTARMHAIGAPVHGRLLVAYTISAALAGVAGALSAHTNAYVTLAVFGFENSAGVLVMLILGGIGRLYGAFWGAVVYMVLQDSLAKLSPAFWQAGVGLLLIGTVLFARAGILGLVEAAGRRLRGGRS
jgi:branched-chain amino acid transport system permease protein